MAASYPSQLKKFKNLVDFVDINQASHFNEIYDELTAIETTIGITPFASLPYTSINAAISDLYLNKASSDHQHTHLDLQNRTADDHTNLSLITGTRAFTAPVTGVAGTGPSNAVTLSQFNSQGYLNATQLDALPNNVLNIVEVATVPEEVLYGALVGASPAYVFTGGYYQGTTDSGGRLTTPLAPRPFNTSIISFDPEPSQTGLAANQPLNTFQNYDPTSTECALVSINFDFATVVFYNSTTGSPVTAQNCAFSWLALGI
jgi:hypothetical protein